MSQPRGYSLKEYGIISDERGALVALEGADAALAASDVPFAVKRVFYIFDLPYDAVRGVHAHKGEADELIFCLRGSCDFLLDDGLARTTVHLDKAHLGLYIEGRLWREFTHFSPDCLLLVLASGHYKDAIYIRDYDEFLAFMRENR